MKKILSAIVFAGVLLLFGNAVFASDFEYVTRDVNNNKYYIDKQSISRIKWDKDKDDFQFSVIVKTIFDEYDANNRYDDFWFRYRGIYITDTVAYSLDRLVFRRKKGKISYKSSGAVDFNSSGQKIWSWDGYSTWHDVPKNSVYKVIYDVTYKKL